ncbi:MAG TPA: PilZ domain-containing protein [Hyphomicrobiaceae bacterium]|nr:PilZ domain-containing protein [Hyphomicrobiaceae bacterium]
MLVERRKFPRYELRLNGRILSPDMSYGVECAIRDMSETGALVSTEAPERLPSRVYLWQPQTGSLFECEVRWQKFDKLFGLRFIDICGRSQRRMLIERFAFERQPQRAANSNFRAAAPRSLPAGGRLAKAG